MIDYKKRIEETVNFFSSDQGSYKQLEEDLLALLHQVEAESQLAIVRKSYFYIADHKGSFVKTAALTYLDKQENELRAALTHREES